MKGMLPRMPPMRNLQRTGNLCIRNHTVVQQNRRTGQAVLPPAGPEPEGLRRPAAFDGQGRGPRISPDTGPADLGDQANPLGKVARAAQRSESMAQRGQDIL